MTLDQAMFSASLDALDTDVIPKKGTDVGAAIRGAVEAMASEPDHHKVLVILTDGEDLQGDAMAAARQAARAGVVIYTVGVGTSAGALVPVDHEGRPGVLRDAGGSPVRSRLDEPTLRSLAAATGGAYAALGADGRGLETLYRQHLATLPRSAAKEQMRKVWTERFPIPLGVAVGALLLELAVGERRGRRTRGGALGLAAALVLLVGLPRFAAAAPASGGQPAAAAKDATTTYNDGTSAYRKRDFAAAKVGFQNATHTTDLGLQADAYYDLGNASYRIGQAALARRDRTAARNSWQEALAAYDGTLALAPQDQDARFNRDLVARRLKELDQEEKEQQEKSSRQGSSSQSQNGQPNGQGKEQGDQSGGSSSSSQPGNNNGSPAGSPQNGTQRGQRSASGQGQGQAENEQKGRAQFKGQAQSQGQGQRPAQRQAQSQDGNTTESQESGSSQAHAQASAANAPPQASRGGEKQSAEGQPQPSPAAGRPSPTPKGPGVVGGPGPQPQGELLGADTTRAAPGALTATEARQLLDSVNGELRPTPAAGDSRRSPAPETNPEKDW
jgi:Ca-activated chloride channel family protein